MCGIIKAAPAESGASTVESWLADGCGASLAWMERNKEPRYDPRLLLEGGAQTLVVCGLSYLTINSLLNHPVAAYAHAADYHHTVKKLLTTLHHNIETHTNQKIEGRSFCDSAPILERYWAVKAGLGWIGKNSMVTNREIGSYFFIGVLLLAIPFDSHDSEDRFNGCAKCSRCIDNCKSGAIRPNKSIDCRKCVSYLTIEKRGEYNDLEKEIIRDWDDRIFGCDRCISVCPWNIKALKKLTAEKDTEKRRLLNSITLESDIDYWRVLDKATFKNNYSKLPIARAGYEKISETISLLSKKR